MLYNSRGEYRMADNTLHVPGHPPVPLENIRQIDETRFARKGIVYIDYDVPASAVTARLKLDDFVYDQAPTDAIFDRIKATVLPPDEPAPEAAADLAADAMPPADGGQTEA